MDLMDYRRKIIANSPHLKSASGAVATFADGTDLPLKNLMVNIEPVQSGSGDPSPSNVRPISGWNAVNVTRSGKSALKPSTAFTETKNGLTFTSDGNGTYSVKGTNTATATVRSAILPVPSFTIPPSTTHTLYINNNAINSDVLLNFMIGSTAIDSWAFNALNREVPTYGAMGNKLCDGLQIVVRAGQTVDITFSPMLLPKENADVYNVSLSSAGTVYGGTLNVLTGVLTVDKVALVIDGVNIKFNQVAKYGTLNRFGVSYPTGLKAKYSGSTSFCMSDKIKPSWENTVAINTARPEGYYCFPHSSAFFVSMPSSVIGGENTSEANAWAETNRPTVCYELDTPYTIQLTPQQVRSLYGNNTIFAGTGNVALEYWAHP